MPPVLGPTSPSPTRLKSWAGSSATTCVPSEMQNTDSSWGPVEVLLDDDPPAGLGRGTARRAGGPPAGVGHDDTLAGGQAVVLDDVRGPNASSADPTSSSVVHMCASAVGTSAAAMTSLANDLLPSSRGRRGKVRRPRSPAERHTSATPATSGASGPTTTRSTSCSRASEATACRRGCRRGRRARSRRCRGCRARR